MHFAVIFLGVVMLIIAFPAAFVWIAWRALWFLVSTFIMLRIDMDGGQNFTPQQFWILVLCLTSGIPYFLERRAIRRVQTMKNIEASGNVEQLVAVVGNEPAAILTELNKLYAELKKYDPNADTELQRVKNAEEAAKRADGAGIISNLSGAPRWVLDFAQKIGTTLIARLIEKQMGFGH